MSNGSLIITRRKFLHQAAISASAFSLWSFTGDASKNSMRFGLVTDSHYANRDPNGTRYYRQALEKMREFVEVMNEEQVDFIMHLGDFKDEDPNKQEEDTLNYLKKMEEVYGAFNGPRYHCVGNHDVDSITKAQFLANVVNTGIPSHQSFYSFDQGSYHMVVLDANFHSNQQHQFYKEGADWQDPNIGERQLQWLKQNLKDNSKPTLVFCHHPLFEYYRDQYKFHVNQYQQVQKILQRSKTVLAVFQGHVHEEKHRRINDIHYLTQLALVDYPGLENNSFAIVEVDQKAITVKGFKRVSSRNF